MGSLLNLHGTKLVALRCGLPNEVKENAGSRFENSVEEGVCFHRSSRYDRFSQFSRSPQPWSNQASKSVTLAKSSNASPKSSNGAIVNVSVLVFSSGAIVPTRRLSKRSTNDRLTST